MKQKMKKLLLNNLSVKLLALLLGCITWFAVMYNLNPMMTKKISVPVSILNDGYLTRNDWTYEVVGNKVVDVTVRAKSFDLSRISADDVYLYVDMNYLEGNSSTERRGTIQSQIKATEIESISLGTDWMLFKLEQIAEREYAIEVRTHGTAAENYTAAEKPQAVPESIKVRGPISEVEKIAKVIFDLEIEEASEDINVTGRPVLLDHEGNELKNLQNVTITPETIQVCQPILQSKTVPIQCEDVTGEPGTGYGLAGISLDMDTIRVSGYKAVLANITTLEIPAELININGLVENKTFPINLADLVLPEGITLMGGDTFVNVTVKIEKKKQNNFRLQLPDDISLLNKKDDFSYSFEDTSMYITVEGIGNDLSSMEAANIIASVDVSGLIDAGVYRLLLDVKLPDDINLVGSVYVSIIVTREETPTEPLPTVPTTPEIPVIIPTQPTVENTTTEENTTESTTAESVETTESVPETEATAEVVETEDPNNETEISEE